MPYPLPASGVVGPIRRRSPERPSNRATATLSQAQVFSRQAIFGNRLAHLLDNRFQFLGTRSFDLLFQFGLLCFISYKTIGIMKC
jgi:hypothetical protein